MNNPGGITEESLEQGEIGQQRSSFIHLLYMHIFTILHSAYCMQVVGCWNYQLPYRSEQGEDYSTECLSSVSGNLEEAMTEVS